MLTHEVGGDWSIDGINSGSEVRDPKGPAVTDEKKSGPVLDGVLVTVGMLPELGHEVIQRGSKGAGESIEVADMVSRSGVRGSKYGFVVLRKVTDTTC